MPDNIRESVYSDLKIFYHTEKVNDTLNGRGGVCLYQDKGCKWYCKCWQNPNYIYN